MFFVQNENRTHFIRTYYKRKKNILVECFMSGGNRVCNERILFLSTTSVEIDTREWCVVMQNDKLICIRISIRIMTTEQQEEETVFNGIDVTPGKDRCNHFRREILV